MDIRDLNEKDLPALLDLSRRTLPFDSFSMPMLRRRVFDEPEHNPRYQLSLWDGARLAGVLLGGVRPTEDGRAAWVRLVAVDADDRRQGLASQLLAELENRLRADGLTRLRVGNSAPNYLWPGLDVSYTPALCFFLARGFERNGDAINMLVELDARDWDTTGEEARLAQTGVLIRRLQPDDRPGFGAWLQQQWNPVWQYEGLSSYANDPISTFVAISDGQIRAFASYNVAAPEAGFGPTGTQPEFRGRGIGRVLFFHCMRDLKDLGHHVAEVCWVGPIAFYARVAGATINRTFWHLEKQL
jgi:GNAT superfamily N-acetyltransferase